MNDMNAMLADPNFFYGAAVMGILMMFLMFYAAYLRAESLYLSFKARSAIKVGKSLYYLVTEHEWNKWSLTIQWHKPEVNADQGDQERGPFVMFALQYGARFYYSGAGYRTPVQLANFYRTEAEAMQDRYSFRSLFPLDRQCNIEIKSIRDMRMDELGRTKLLAIAKAAIAENQGNKNGASANQGL